MCVQKAQVIFSTDSKGEALPFFNGAFTEKIDFKKYS
jgi:hypothetical protein